MKKLHVTISRYSPVFILLCSAFVITSTHAQDTCTYAKEGTVEIGGFFTYGSGQLNQSPNVFTLFGLSSDLLSFAPFIGWFPIDGLEIGLSPFVSTLFTSDGTQTYPQTMFLVSTSLVKEINTKTFLFIEGMIGLTHLTEVPKVYVSDDNNPDFESPVVTSFSKGFATGTRIGFKYDTGNKTILTVGMQYFHTRYNISNSYTFFGYDHVSYVVGFTAVL